MHPLIKGYQQALNEALLTIPPQHYYLAQCRHCRIEFITAPSNRGRVDLGCPMGCRQAFRRKESSRRSQDYYHTAEGREHKKMLNQRRRKMNPCAEKEAIIVEPLFTPSAILYFLFLGRVIIGRRVTLEQIEQIVKRVKKRLRQRSLDFHRREDNILAKHDGNAGI